MKMNKPGVNYCHCLICHAEFFFNTKDIKSPDESLGEKFPMVKCPNCGHDMKLGWNDRYFTYKKTKDKEYE